MRGEKLFHIGAGDYPRSARGGGGGKDGVNFAGEKLPKLVKRDTYPIKVGGGRK